MTIPVPAALKVGKARENKSQRVASTQYVVTKEVSTGAISWVSFDVFDTEADARSVCAHLKAVFDGSDASTTLSAHDDAINRLASSHSNVTFQILSTHLR